MMLLSTKAYNEGHVSEGYRIAKLKEEFGERPAESIPIAEFKKYFEEQNWVPGTYNRCRTVLYSIYRLGIENKKVSENPMKELKRRKVSDERERYLNQYPPLESKIDYLKSLHTEEERLRAVIMNDCPEHLDEFIIALNTGLRHKEQYVRIDWTCVDLIRKDLAVPPSKNGKPRHVNLNQEALAAFARLRTRQTGENVTPISLTGPIFIGKGGERLGGSRHWWDDAVKKAAIRNFTWHDLRHTFASRLVMAGVDLSTVADLMGHINIQMTKRYAHLTSAHKQDVVDRLCTPIDTAQTGTSSR